MCKLNFSRTPVFDLWSLLPLSIPFLLFPSHNAHLNIGAPTHTPVVNLVPRDDHGYILWRRLGLGIQQKEKWEGEGIRPRSQPT